MLTLDPRRPVAEALAVGRGRVLALGTAAQVRALAGPRTERVDCRGATVLPGLIDPHLHLFGLAARDAHLDCAGAGSVDELLRLVGRQAARVPVGAWVRGEGLDEARLGRLPSAAELAAVAPRNPVRLRHRSRHASVLSDRALARFGGGRGVERRGGVATGLVAGREAEIGRLVGPLDASLLARGLVRAARELAAVGVTTVADATPRGLRALAPLRRLLGGGDILLRVYAMRPPGARRWSGAGGLLPGPVKIVVEDGPGGLRPDAPGLARRVALAAADGSQVAVHCVTAASLVAVVAAFGELPATLRAGRRHRLEHVAECPPPLLGPIASLGLVAVTNPAFIHWRGDAYREETRGPARGWLYRARSLAAAGIPLAGASDAPVVPPNPWVGMAAARTRRTASGRPLGSRERLGAAAALGLFTYGAAFALHADSLGRLRPGGPADVIVVTPDPLRAPPDEVAAAEVRFTLVGGERAWPA